MPYITSVERMGIEKGRAEGRMEELLSTIELLLNIRFGEAGVALMPELTEVAEYDRLRTVRDAILTAEALETLYPLYRRDATA